MTGLETMITKIVNAIDSQRERQESAPIPTIGQAEAESLYLSRLEALDAEERHLRRQLQERRQAPRWGLD